ncbi:unnamed protein product, partial [Polarella glacialis]
MGPPAGLGRLLVAVASLGFSVEGAAGGFDLIPLTELPLKTAGRFIVGTSGRRAHMACVNWYGAAQRQMVMNGLDRQPPAVIAARIVELGFNCVRFPFNLEMLFVSQPSVPNPGVVLAAAPELWPLSALEIFDRTLASLTDVGLLVVVNNHVSAAGWCCSASDGEGLWYTDKYSEEDWLTGIGMVANRYRLNPRVVGFDLRNEVRPSGMVLPTWGTGDASTDWSMA